MHFAFLGVLRSLCGEQLGKASFRCAFFDHDAATLPLFDHASADEGPGMRIAVKRPLCRVQLGIAGEVHHTRGDQLRCIK